MNFKPIESRVVRYCKIIYLVLLCKTCIVTATSAQNTWFRIYDLGFRVESGIHVDYFGDRIFYVSWSGGIDEFRTRNELICLDNSGDIIWREFLIYPESANGTADYRPLGLAISKDSSIYVYTEARTQSLGCIVNKFSYNGELIWMREYYEEDADIFPSFHGVGLMNDSLTIAICGTMRFDDGDEKLIVYHLDENGDIVNQIVTDPSESRISPRVPLIQLHDESLLVAYNRSIANVDLLSDHFIHILNFEQAIEYPTTSSSNPEETKYLARLPNGNIVYLSREPYTGELIGGMRVSVYTPTLDSLWSYLYQDVEVPYPFIGTSRPLTLSVSEDGKILAVGYTIRHAALLCFEPDGTLLWTKKVAVEGSLYWGIQFGQASWTSDNGIILCGNLIEDASGCNEQQGCFNVFLFKLDSMGCLTPGCEDVSIVTSTADVPSADEAFRVFPNPVRGDLNLIYRGKKPIENLDAQVLIYDVQGQFIHTSAITHSTTKMDVSQLPQGLIYLHIQTREGGSVVPVVKQ